MVDWALFICFLFNLFKCNIHIHRVEDIASDPQYLAELHQMCIPSRSLRSSADDKTGCILTVRRKQLCKEAFVVVVVCCVVFPTAQT